MAGNYSTDLTTLAANETNGMVEPTATTPENWTNLNAFSSAETDYFIQGTACTSATMKVGVGGALTNNTAFTLGADDAVLCWAYLWCPANLDLESNGGARQMIGSSQAAFHWVSQSGSDDWLYGGWRCFAMGNPANITKTTVGSPTTSFAYTGWAAKMLAVPGKGNPYGVDSVRNGRCQIKVTSGTANFAEIEEFNSKNSTAARTGFTLIDSGYHRLGLFQYQNGSYLWKGKMLLGETGVAACTFSDSNKTILVENTKNVTANFNLIEIQHASSNVAWTGISIQSLGTVSKGRFLMTDAATVAMTTCTFTDMSTFVFQSTGTVLSTTFRRCGQVTAGGGTFTGCTFDASTDTTGALLINSAAQMLAVTACGFKSNAKAIKITASGTYTFDGHQFTGNTVQVDFTGTGTCTINPTNGCNVVQADCTASGGGTIVVNAAQITLTLTGMITGSDIVINTSDTNTALVNIDQNVGSSYGYTYGYTPGTYVDIKVVIEGYLPYQVYDYLLASSNASLPISQVTDRVFV